MWHITKISCKNFRCFEDITVDLEPFTVLVGPNNVGKTAFLELVKHISNLAVQKWAQAFAPLDKVLFDDDVTRTLDIQLEASADERNVSYEMSLGTRGIVWETLMARWQKFVTRAINPSGVLESTCGPEIPADITALFHARKASDTKIPFAEDCREFAEWLLHSEIFELDPKKLSQPSEIGPTDAPEADGSKLPAFLDHLQNNDPDGFNELVSLVKEAVPEIESITLPSTPQRQKEIAIKQKRLRKPRRAADASSGVLLFLGYVSLLFAEKKYSILMFEEPETGVHPARLQFIVDLLRRMTVGFGSRPPVQVIATSHSPHLLDHLEPKELVLMRRNKKGKIECVRGDNVESCHKYLEGGSTLGEFFYEAGHLA